MNKYIKKLLVLAMTAAMVLSMGVAAYAADGAPETKTPTATESPSGLTTNGTGGTPANSEVQADTTSINLVKHYDKGANSAETALRPAEDFTITITPIGAWNVGNKVTENAIPALGTANSGTIIIEPTTNVTTIKVSHPADTKDNSADREVDYLTELTIPGAGPKPGASTDAERFKGRFPTTGDYWYEVKETPNNVTGVTYGTNATTSDTDGNRVYYIHVQVVNFTSDTVDGALYKSVTLHTEGPDPTQLTNDIKYKEWVEQKDTDGNATYDPYKNNADQTAKLTDIKNEYNAGSLSIHKDVTGNAGETAKRFKVTVVFTKPAGTIITSDITYSAATEEFASEMTNNLTIKNQKDTNSNWFNIPEGATPATKVSGDSKEKLTNTVEFWIKNDETVIFDNIPFGVTYTVVEEDPGDGHTNKITFEDKSALDTTDDVTAENPSNDFAETASGKIDDALDPIEIENHKEIPIDVGVILENAPYVAILLIAAAAVVVFARRRKVSEEY